VDILAPQRAAFVRTLIQARYPHKEIRALALHVRNQLGPSLSDQAFRREIDRLLTTYTPPNDAPTPTREKTSDHNSI
jgi:hypothetical protein